MVRDAQQLVAAVQVALGDARLQLREAADHSYGLLVLDTFTGDAIPVHLLTKEAITECLLKLRHNGVLACNISNRYVDLEPILENIAAELGCVAFFRIDEQLKTDERSRGKQPSRSCV